MKKSRRELNFGSRLDFLSDTFRRDAFYNFNSAHEQIFGNVQCGKKSQTAFCKRHEYSPSGAFFCNFIRRPLRLNADHQSLSADFFNALCAPERTENKR